MMPWAALMAPSHGAMMLAMQVDFSLGGTRAVESADLYVGVHVGRARGYCTASWIGKCGMDNDSGRGKRFTSHVPY